MRKKITVRHTHIMHLGKLESRSSFACCLLVQAWDVQQGCAVGLRRGKTCANRAFSPLRCVACGHSPCSICSPHPHTHKRDSLSSGLKSMRVATRGTQHCICGHSTHAPPHRCSRRHPAGQLRGCIGVTVPVFARGHVRVSHTRSNAPAPPHPLDQSHCTGGHHSSTAARAEQKAKSGCIDERVGTWRGVRDGRSSEWCEWTPAPLLRQTGVCD